MEQSYCKESIAWKEVTQKILGASSSEEKDLIAAIKSKTTFQTKEQEEHILAGLKWIGLFSDEKVSTYALHSCLLEVLAAATGCMVSMKLCIGTFY